MALLRVTWATKIRNRMIHLTGSSLFLFRRRRRGVRILNWALGSTRRDYDVRHVIGGGAELSEKGQVSELLLVVR